MWLLFLVYFLPAGVISLYSSDSQVVTLTDDNFNRKVINSDQVWIVEFFAPWCGHCQNFAPEYDKAAKAVQGIFQVGAVDATVHTSLSSRYNVNGYPTIFIFGHKKYQPEVFNKARSTQGVIDALFEAAKKQVNDKLGTKSDKDSKYAIDLTDANFFKNVVKSKENWLVMFYAPWCAHCKRLKPLFDDAAKEYKGDKVKFGMLDATVHTNMAAYYKIDSYPTLKFFSSHNKSVPDDYNMGHSKEDILDFVKAQMTFSLPPPEVKEVINEDVYNDACIDRLCVVSVLPHIYDCQSKCRNDYLKILQNVAENFKLLEWGWLWSEGGSQIKMEDALGLGGFGYPAMVVLSHKKMKYSLFKGSFSEQSIREFLRDVSFGKASGQTASVKGGTAFPIISIDGWDGNDFYFREEPPEEQHEHEDEDKEEDEDSDLSMNILNYPIEDDDAKAEL